MTREKTPSKKSLTNFFRWQKSVTAIPISACRSLDRASRKPLSELLRPPGAIRPSSRQLYHSNNFFKRRGPGCHGAAAPPRVTAAAPAAVRTAARQGAAAHPRRARGGEHGARLPRPPSRSRRAAAQRQRPRAAARHLCGTGGGAAGEAPAHCAPRGPSPPRPQSLPAPVPIRLRGQRPPLWRDRGE